MLVDTTISNHIVGCVTDSVALSWTNRFLPENRNCILFITIAQRQEKSEQ